MNPATPTLPHGSLRMLRSVALLRLLIMTLMVANPGPASAAAPGPPPRVSWQEGLFFTNSLLHPGKLDLLYKNLKDEERYNAFAWTPLFKGGVGRLDPDKGPNTDYAGGFVRPLASRPDLGDLILGAHWVDSRGREDHEFQGDYRFPFGLGLGGGMAEPQPGNEIAYGKLSYRGKLEGWNYIGAVLWQDTAGEGLPGGYGAIYNANWMGVLGGDGEQWRATAAYLGPERWKVVRPVVEVIYVDNTIGTFTGTRSLFANMTLRYEGGFLSHPSRLGRAMGPQGTEFGNPLGFLTPTWNRRLDVWELGGLVDLRAERIRSATSAITERYEAVFFPGQLDGHADGFDGVFVGGSWSRNPLRDTAGLLAGFAGRIGFLKWCAAVDHEIEPARTTFTLGCVEWF